MRNISDLNTADDERIMNMLLGLPSDIQAWEMQQKKQATKYLSASLKQRQEQENETLRNTCHNCGGPHHVVRCPTLVLNL